MIEIEIMSRGELIKREVHVIPRMGETIVDNRTGEVVVLRVIHMTDTAKIRVYTIPAP